MGQTTGEGLAARVKGFVEATPVGALLRRPATTPPPTTAAPSAPIHDISLPNETGYRDDRLPLDPVRLYPTRAEAARDAVKKPAAKPRSLAKGR